MVASHGIEKRLFPGVTGMKAKFGMFGEVSAILKSGCSYVDKVLRNVAVQRGHTTKELR